MYCHEVVPFLQIRNEWHLLALISFSDHLHNLLKRFNNIWFSPSKEVTATASSMNWNQLYHCIPDEINGIAKIFYSNFSLSIITNDFHTKYIAIENGVLQGNSFSHLVFNLIISTFIQCVTWIDLMNRFCNIWFSPSQEVTATASSVNWNQLCGRNPWMYSTQNY